MRAGGPAAAAPITASAAEIGALSCATAGVPDATTQADPYQVDTGAAFVGQPAANFVGAAYGQPMCPDQFLVEVDLSSSGAAGRDVFVTAFWSVVLPGAPCGYRSTMTVWGESGSEWVLHDRITFEGQPWTDASGKPYCQPQVTGRLIPSDLGGTSIPANRYDKARVAVVATDCGHRVPVDVVVQ